MSQCELEAREEEEAGSGETREEYDSQSDSSRWIGLCDEASEVSDETSDERRRSAAPWVGLDDDEGAELP